MANTTQLQAAPRAEHGKNVARKIRSAGRVPAVLYGHGVAARSLSLDAQTLDRVFARISIENTILDLEIEGERAVPVLVREVQRHPYLPRVLHVDFYQVRAGEQVTLEVPVRLLGNPIGVRSGGVLDHTLHNLDVRCTPDRIPEAIEVDVEGLEVNATIHVRDLAAPAGVEILTDADLAVCSVVPPTVPALEEGSEASTGVGSVSPALVKKPGAEA